MGEIAEMLWANAVRTREIGLSLAGDVPPEQFARLPLVDGQPVFMNHPAFVYGHLALYPARVLKMAGFDPREAAAPYWYDELFAPGAICQDDPFGEIYPDKEQLVTQFGVSLRIASERLRGVGDERLSETHTLGPELGSTILSLGAAADYLLNNHPLFHLGQVSAWRRCMGQGSAEWTADAFRVTDERESGR